MNGTMDEPMDTSPDVPANPIKVTSDIIETTVKHCENGNKTDNGEGDHLENESGKESTTNSNVENAVNENSSDGLDRATSNSGNEASVESDVKDNNLNENTLSNHCSNSNESMSDSVTSSHAKSDINEVKGIKNTDEKSKDLDSETNCNQTENTNGEDSDDIDSEADSSDEEGSVISGEAKPGETVSINSDSECDDDTSQESQTKDDQIIILDNENRPNSQNNDAEVLSPSSEIHEITSDNDDCILANDDKSNTSDSKVNLRRSNRAVKRKRYSDDIENGDDESDIEEVEPEDPLNHKTKPIVINDTKALVEMAAKQMKSNNNQKKETTVVIIDTHSKGSAAAHNKNSVSTTLSNSSAQSLYQSIVARGTTVTPVSSKTNTPAASTLAPTQTTQPSILPSLTDDMFVVEAPSFIVPYVYEKPSVKPFREFVDVLGKELEMERAKKEQEKLEKEKEEKAKREKERSERKERGEVVSESEDESSKLDKSVETEDDAKKKKRAEKKERRKQRTEEDDASWDGESSTESDDETMSDDEGGTVIIKDKADSIEEIKTSTDLTSTKATSTSTGKSDNYFDCSLGKFFINIGLNLVQEFVQNDLLKQQNRKLYREKKSGHSTKATESSIASLMKNLEFSKENNAPFAQPQLKCEFCSFKTESMLAMNNHLETPHMKNNVYKCNFCKFEIRSPHDILYHMEAEHNIRGKLERAPSYHQCPNCPFEDNGKGKLARHQIACAKKYKPELNLSPPIEWEPPAKIPKLTRARNSMVNSYQSVFNRQVHGSMPRGAASVGGMVANYRARGRSPLAAPRPALPGAPIVRSGVVIRHNAPSPVLMPNNYPVGNNGKSKQPSISITPLPRQPQPALPQPSQQNKGTFVICEICDGYIKDLEQLRNHMQWIHKVKIHPKMIYNRPPLNCQKCQFRFFTDQGLERHLLGSHGLVTSSMQEAANKGKDAGRCPVCGRVYQWKLLNHVARDHNLTLKPAHLSYKCTVCTATFGMYKQFENHVYSAHSVVAKRVMDKNKTSTPPAKTNDALLKPLKINDEITIIPQPVKQAASAKNK